MITKLRFKKLIILFWTLWWLIALWTDVVGLMAHYGLLNKSWAPDINYPFLLASLEMYKAPEWVTQVAFIGILSLSFLSTLAFCWASAGLHREEHYWLPRADLAFIVSLSFWMAFFIADQLVMKFDLEENHMVQGGFQLLTYLSLYLLPSQNNQQSQS